jgi:hypothetical protein
MRVAIIPLTWAQANCSFVRSGLSRRIERGLPTDVPYTGDDEPVPCAQSTASPGAYTCTLTFVVPGGPVV